MWRQVQVWCSTVSHHKLHPEDSGAQWRHRLVTMKHWQPLHVGLVAEHHGRENRSYWCFTVVNALLLWKGKGKDRKLILFNKFDCLETFKLKLPVTSLSPRLVDDGEQRLCQLIRGQTVEVEDDGGPTATQTCKVIRLIPKQWDSD